MDRITLPATIPNLLMRGSPVLLPEGVDGVVVIPGYVHEPLGFHTALRWLAAVFSFQKLGGPEDTPTVGAARGLVWRQTGPRAWDIEDGFGSRVRCLPVSPGVRVPFSYAIVPELASLKGGLHLGLRALAACVLNRAGVSR
jgi:hypothetical protein